MLTALRALPARWVALAAATLAATGLTLTHHASPRPLPDARARAVADDFVRRHALFDGLHPSRVQVMPVDAKLDRVTYYEGDRVAAEVAVTNSASVSQGVNFKRLKVPYGDWIAYQPLVLALLGTVFVLLAGVVPLRRRRNLDVLAALSMLGPMVLLQHRLLLLSVVCAVPGLLWLLSRAAIVGLGPPRPVGPAQSLFDVLTANWEPGRRVRTLRLVLVGLLLVFAMVGISSDDAVDVIYAVMEGATKILHGTLPYGHLPGDVIHGDTYPILSYALYVPLALIAPVNDVWQSVDLALGFTVLTAAGAAVAIARFRVPPSPEGANSTSADEGERSLKSALIWLTFPPLLGIVSSGTTDVLLGVMVLTAVLLWRRPTASAAVLTAAAWFKLAPAALLPLWLSARRGHPARRAVVAVVAVSVGPLLLLVALGGIAGPISMLHSMAYQFSRGSPQSLWSALGLQDLQPLAQGAVVGALAGACVRLRREPELSADPARLAALAAAVLIALQLSADFWSFLYLAWVAPLLSISVLRAPVRRPAEASLPVARPSWSPALAR